VTPSRSIRPATDATDVLNQRSAAVCPRSRSSARIGIAPTASGAPVTPSIGSDVADIPEQLLMLTIRRMSCVP